MFELYEEIKTQLAASHPPPPHNGAHRQIKSVVLAASFRFDFCFWRVISPDAPQPPGQRQPLPLRTPSSSWAGVGEVSAGEGVAGHQRKSGAGGPTRKMPKKITLPTKYLPFPAPRETKLRPAMRAGITTLALVGFGVAEGFASKGQLPSTPKRAGSIGSRMPLDLSGAAAAGAARETMNPEDVARFPLPGTASPISLSFSPDDNILSYLHAEGGQLTRQVTTCALRCLPKSWCSSSSVVVRVRGTNSSSLSFSAELSLSLGHIYRHIHSGGGNSDKSQRLAASCPVANVRPVGFLQCATHVSFFHLPDPPCHGSSSMVLSHLGTFRTGAAARPFVTAVEKAERFPAPVRARKNMYAFSRTCSALKKKYTKQTTWVRPKGSCVFLCWIGGEIGSQDCVGEVFSFFFVLSGRSERESRQHTPLSCCTCSRRVELAVSPLRARPRVGIPSHTLPGIPSRTCLRNSSRWYILG